jgi:uncharacterized protein YjbI with pentapeptide repeats
MIKEILEKHLEWINGQPGGNRAVFEWGADLSDADLSDANLSYANLLRANLSDANLSDANLSDANLLRANLSDANLSDANLLRANLLRANLSDANLLRANLLRANLSDANLLRANLSDANLLDANLLRANLSDANLLRANLSDANLSDAKNLITAREFMGNFKKDKLGFLVYKRIGANKTNCNPPEYWEIKKGAFLEEVVNPLPTVACACGVNFGTLDWCKSNYINADLWLCRIRWEDLPDVVVPYNTDGKARCGRLELVKIVDLHKEK